MVRKTFAIEASLASFYALAPQDGVKRAAMRIKKVSRYALMRPLRLVGCRGARWDEPHQESPMGRKDQRAIAKRLMRRDLDRQRADSPRQLMSEERSLNNARSNAVQGVNLNPQSSRFLTSSAIGSTLRPKV